MTISFFIVRHKVIFLKILFFLFTNFLFPQNGHDCCTFSFEKKSNDSIVNWEFSNYNYIDTTIHKEGKKVLHILKNDEKEMFTVSKNIRFNTSGDTLIYTGYIKAENISSRAYFFIVLSNNREQINYKISKDFNGSFDWEKFSIEIPCNEKVNHIEIAFNLEGKGEIWLDGIEVFLDDKNICELEVFENDIEEKPLYSAIEIPNSLTDEEIERIISIIKIWGFVKYYHPNLNLAKIDIDKQFFELLKKYNSENFYDVVEKWLRSFGSINQEKSVLNVKKNYVEKCNFDWISEIKINLNSRNILIDILNSKRKIGSIYVNQDNSINISNFDSENPYPNILFNDDGFKLLALARFWNIVEYFYPYKYLIHKKWNKVLQEEIIEFINSETEIDYLKAINRLIKNTEDSHSKIVKSGVYEEFLGLKKGAVRLKYIDQKIIISDILFENKNGLKIGEELVFIDKIPVKKLIEEKKQFYSGSNKTFTNQNTINNLLRTNNDSITIGIKSRSNSEFKIPTYYFEKYADYKVPKQKIKIFPDSIGYIFPKNMNREQIDSLFISWNKMKGIIIDLRCYTKENLPYIILPYLMKSKNYSFFNILNVDIKEPGNFYFLDRPVFNNIKESSYHGKIMIIVDVNTHSKSEFCALGLLNYNKTKIIGSQTSGTDGDIQLIKLPGNIDVALTLQGIYTLDYKSFQKKGIDIDFKINETIKDIRNQKDIYLEQAIKKILQD